MLLDLVFRPVIWNIAEESKRYLDNHCPSVQHTALVVLSAKWGLAVETGAVWTSWPYVVGSHFSVQLVHSWDLRSAVPDHCAHVSTPWAVCQPSNVALLAIPLCP